MREGVYFSGIAKRLDGIAFGSQADQKSFEKLRAFFHKERGHMVGFISNIAPLLNYLRRRGPGPPFPPDSCQAGERGGH